jgi:hypothetical protein
MSGEHRHHPELVDDPSNGGGIELVVGEAVERGGDAALLGSRAADAVMAAPTLVVHVLGGVGKHRQPPERSDEVELVVDRPGRKGIERIEWAPAVPAGGDGPTAHVLDQREHLVAGLIADDVAEQATEQTDVVAERGVLVGPWFRGGLGVGRHGTRRYDRSVAQRRAATR